MNTAVCHNLPLTSTAYYALHALDEKTLVGTPDYLGLAFFWNYEYRHYLREATPKQRKLVHDLLIEAGLSLDGASPDHAAIIEKHLSKRRRNAVAAL